MGRSIYFTDLEIEKLIDGLGSAIRKLYKGRRGEKIYAKYKTKRGKGKRSNF